MIEEMTPLRKKMVGKIINNMHKLLQERSKRTIVIRSPNVSFHVSA